jgi:hypothetical protein
VKITPVEAPTSSIRFDGEVRPAGSDRFLMVAACFITFARERSFPHSLRTYTSVCAAE